ncbi:MAG: hypothetical protein F4Y04_02830 [Chloroflexi bacterium]|nr:hypothetical protein [Chloroflexota bacterium]
MAIAPDQTSVQYEPEEPCPPLVALVVGLQGAALVLAPTVLIVAISIRASGLDDTYLTWGVFAALLINAATTALQAFQAWRFGGGHIVITGPTAQFIGITVAAISAAGPETLASLLAVCFVIQVALAWWLPTFRRIVTPVVSGTVMILIAITILPIAFDNIQTLPEGASAGAGPAIAAMTLLVSVILTLRATGRWRLIAPFLSIVVGCLVTVAFGEFDVQRIGEASWFGVPDIPDLGFDLTPGKEFWALLPTFAILTLTMGIKSISDSVVIQQASRRRRRAIDFRQVQGMVGANGVGMLLAGIAGTPPTMIYSSFSMTLINLTGVAARRVGIGVAVVFVALAFFSKFAAVLLSIPGPVLAAYLMLAMGLFFVGGVQTIIRGGLDPRRGLIVALSIALGLGLHEHSVIRDLLGDELGALLGNGVMIGAVVAIGMTLLLEAMNSKASRLEVTLDMASLAAIDEFLARLAAQIGWNEASALRLRSAGEETLASLLPEDEDEAESSDAPRLIMVARPQSGVVELEFVATTRRENLEDQMTYLTDEAAMPAVNELSLRLLRHYSSNVRHQKFHGVDIVTVQVEGSG